MIGTPIQIIGMIGLVKYANLLEIGIIKIIEIIPEVIVTVPDHFIYD